MARHLRVEFPGAIYRPYAGGLEASGQPSVRDDKDRARFPGRYSGLTQRERRLRLEPGRRSALTEALRTISPGPASQPPRRQAEARLNELRNARR